MRSFGGAAALVAATLFSSAVLAANVDPIVIKGSKFFYKTNGTQFFMKGVAYQQEVGPAGSGGGAGNNYVDPLADVTSCTRDIPLLQQLQTNTIRVYAIDPTKDHSKCMQMLQDAGIYVVADLSQPDVSINRDDATWNVPLYQRYTSVVDALAPYNNVLGFFAGNEVSNQQNNTAASAFVKAAVRDTKAYIKAKNYRPMGVGYATNDDKEIRENLADYFNCGDVSQAIDFWGYNIYSWCGNSSYHDSGFDVRTEEFSSYSVPVFFAEYGCNTIQPREFTEVGALYGDQMSPVWSGGIVYMYFQEANDYGLVSVSGNTASKLPDFSVLSSQIAQVTPSGVQMGSYNPTNTKPANCPSVAPTWRAQASPLPPAVNAAACDCMMQSLTCTVSSSTEEDDYQQLFSQVCGYGDQYCAGIQHNATTGKFGAYSMCNSTAQLSFAFNQYASSQSGSGNNNACNFGGNAKAKAAIAANGNCKSLLNQAGTAGTGSVTAAPGASSTGGSTSKGAAGAMTVPSFETGMMQMGLYLIVAICTGAGMILL